MTGPPKPDAPDDIPQYILDGLNRQGPETLSHIANYAEELVAWKNIKAEAKLQTADAGQEDSADDADRPDDVPAKASVVIKTINEHQYYYYQWRDGDQIKSKYKAPVSPDE